MHYSYYYFDSVELSSLKVSWNVDKCEVIDITLKVADQLPQPFLVRNSFRGLQLTAHRNEFVHQQLPPFVSFTININDFSSKIGSLRNVAESSYPRLLLS